MIDIFFLTILLVYLSLTKIPEETLRKMSMLCLFLLTYLQCSLKYVNGNM